MALAIGPERIILMTRSYENCGRAVLGKDRSGYCTLKKAQICTPHGISPWCPCVSWVHRLRIDRIRKGRKR